MPRIDFTKAHAAGFDVLVIIDEGNETHLDAPLVTRLCDRHHGIGAFGVVRLTRTPGGLADGTDGRWALDVRDAFGATVAPTADHLRAAARTLIEQGAANWDGVGALAFTSQVGEVVAHRVGLPDAADMTAPVRNDIASDVGRWRLRQEEPLVTASGLNVPRPALSLELGTPHLVVALSSVEELDTLRLEVPPQLEPAPPAEPAEVGATRADTPTVVFVVPGEPLVEQGVGYVGMRVHDGALGEVPARSSAAAAAALAVRYWAGSGAPRRWRVAASGGVLSVAIDADPAGETVVVAGPAEVVATGSATLPMA